MFEHLISQPNNPFFYWYVYFIFAPMFTFGYWGLAGMALFHLIVFAILLKARSKATKTQTWPRRLLGAMGLLVLTNILVGAMVYGSLWLFIHFLRT